MESEESEESIFEDYEVIHDGLGISYFLLRKRCKNCDG